MNDETIIYLNTVPGVLVLYDNIDKDRLVYKGKDHPFIDIFKRLESIEKKLDELLPEGMNALKNISTKSLSNEDKAILKDTEYEEACTHESDEQVKLKELISSQPKPKYKVGQLVYCFHRDEIISFIIEDIKITDTDVWYSCRENESQVNEFIETIIFSTRQALIDAQNEYWKSLLNRVLEKLTE